MGFPPNWPKKRCSNIAAKAFGTRGCALGMFNSAAEARRRPNTGGFRLTPARNPTPSRPASAAPTLVPAGATSAAANSREVGRLSGLVQQGEQVVGSLLESMRALKEKNRLLAEADLGQVR